jgi:ribonuclease P protein component
MPPELVEASAGAGHGPVPVEVIRKRAAFVAAARGRRVATPAFILQALRRPPDEDGGPVRVGFTASKKVGNAVARNLAKRRLREIARRVLPLHGQAGWDYVLIGRPGITGTRNFALMLQELVDALRTVHAPRRPERERPE